MPSLYLPQTCCQLDVFVWCGNLSDGSDVLFEVFRTIFFIIKSACFFCFLDKLFSANVPLLSRNVDVWAWTDVVKVKHLLLDMLSNLLLQNENILTQEMIVFLLRFLMEPTKSAQPQQNELARDLILRNGTHIEYWIHMVRLVLHNS